MNLNNTVQNPCRQSPHTHPVHPAYPKPQIRQAMAIIKTGEALVKGKLGPRWKPRLLILRGDGVLSFQKVDSLAVKRQEDVLQWRISENIFHTGKICYISMRSKSEQLNLGFADRESAENWHLVLQQCRDNNTNGLREWNASFLKAKSFNPLSTEFVSSINALPVRDWHDEWNSWFRTLLAAESPGKAAVYSLGRLATITAEFEDFARMLVLCAVHHTRSIKCWAQSKLPTWYRRRLGGNELESTWQFEYKGIILERARRSWRDQKNRRAEVDSVDSLASILATAGKDVRSEWLGLLVSFPVMTIVEYGATLYQITALASASVVGESVSDEGQASQPSQRRRCEAAQAIISGLAPHLRAFIFSTSQREHVIVSSNFKFRQCAGENLQGSLLIPAKSRIPLQVIAADQQLNYPAFQAGTLKCSTLCCTLKRANNGTDGANVRANMVVSGSSEGDVILCPDIANIAHTGIRQRFRAEQRSHTVGDLESVIAEMEQVAGHMHGLLDTTVCPSCEENCAPHQSVMLFLDGTELVEEAHLRGWNICLLPILQSLLKAHQSQLALIIDLEIRGRVAKQAILGEVLAEPSESADFEIQLLARRLRMLNAAMKHNAELYTDDIEAEAPIGDAGMETITLTGGEDHEYWSATYPIWLAMGSFGYACESRRSQPGQAAHSLQLLPVLLRQLRISLKVSAIRSVQENDRLCSFSLDDLDIGNCSWILSHSERKIAWKLQAFKEAYQSATRKHNWADYARSIEIIYGTARNSGANQYRDAITNAWVAAGFAAIRENDIRSTVNYSRKVCSLLLENPEKPYVASINLSIAASFLSYCALEADGDVCTRKMELCNLWRLLHIGYSCSSDANAVFPLSSHPLGVVLASETIKSYQNLGDCEFLLDCATLSSVNTNQSASELSSPLRGSNSALESSLMECEVANMDIYFELFLLHLLKAKKALANYLDGSDFDKAVAYCENAVNRRTSLNILPQLAFSSDVSVRSPPRIPPTFEKLLLRMSQATVITDFAKLVQSGPVSTLISPRYHHKNGGHDAAGSRILELPLGIVVWRLTCSQNHAAILSTNGHLLTWGNGKFGELGHGDLKSSMIPKIVQFFVQNGIKLRDVSCGKSHTSAVSDVGNIYTWGDGTSGQLGLGKDYEDSEPLPCRVACDFSASRVSCGWYHTLALSTSGVIHCWGTGRFGQLGLGPQNATFAPKAIEGHLASRKMIGLSAGERHCAAWDDSGLLFTWGFAKYGALGFREIDKLVVNLPTQVKVISDSFVVQAICDSYRTIVRTEDHRVWVWGSTTEGTLGTGATSLSIPKRDPAVELKTVISHDDSVLAVTTKAKIFCWYLPKGTVNQLHLGLQNVAIRDICIFKDKTMVSLSGEQPPGAE